MLLVILFPFMLKHTLGPQQ